MRDPALRFHPEAFRLLLRGACVLFVSAVLAVSVNAVSSTGIPLSGPVPEPEWEGLKNIGLAEAWDLFQEGGALFVDARSEAEYRRGRIPNAAFLTHDIFDERISSFLELFPPETTIVTYCSGSGCESSAEVGEMLREVGFEDVRVFYGGWDKWKAAGYPEQTDTGSS